MAYNRNNYKKFSEYVWCIYESVKERDVPDTYIVRHVFPKHHIYISYRKWMTIKNEMTGAAGNAQSNQLSLFD